MSTLDRMTALFKAFPRNLKRHAEATLGGLALVAVALLIFRNFLFSNQWPTGGDALGWVARSYLYKDPAKWQYMWRTYSFGFVEIVNGLDFFLSTTFQLLQNSPLMVEVFMFLSFLLAALSSYAFAFRYTHRRISALSASLIYILNQWLTSQLFEVHLEIVFSYALAPLLLLFLDRALEKTRIKDILAAALALSIMVTSFHAECIVIYGVFLVLFTAFYALVPDKKDPLLNRLKRVVKVYLPLSIIVFLTSSFVFLPFLMNAKPQYFSSTYAYSLEEARIYGFKDPIRAFTLGATENWGYVKIVDYQNDLSFPGYPMIITTCILLLCYTAVFIRRNRYTMFFAFSALLATCIAMGPNPPFDRFFIWMWYNIPHFSVFRAISRWLMIMALSHAFFVSQFTDILVSYLAKRRIRRWNRIFFKVETKRGSDERNRWTASIVSINLINRIVRKIHGLLFNLGMFTLVLIIVAPFLSNYFVLSTGLRVYAPNQNYLDPYIWMRDQLGDFKIVTVGQHPRDFADAAIATDSGWGHEIGSESAFLHDKPVLQDGGWESLPHSFVNYLRNRVVPDKMSDKLMTMLGALNYRFVVIPAYASSANREFFLNQEDTHVVYDFGSKILETSSVNQRLFGVSDYYTLVGDLDSLTSLHKVDSFSLHQSALFYADQLDAQFYESPVFLSSEAAVFVDSSLDDILMLSLKEECVVTVNDYGAIGLDNRMQWIQSDYWKNIGQFTFSDKTIVTSGKKSVEVPVDVEPGGNLTIWVRVLFAPKRGTLTISLDNTIVRELKPLSNGPSTFRWISLGYMQIQAGRHVVSLSNDGLADNDVDAIALVEESVLENAKQSLEDALTDFSGSTLCMFEAENVFDYNASSGWRYEPAPYSGFVLKSDEKGSNAALESSTNASSVYNGDLANFGAQETVDDSNVTRWASGLGMPQWIEISWSVPKELSGAEILFENAKAQDYVLQTWNGTDFVDIPETRTVGNNESVKYHRFLRSVKTSKLRLYVTWASEFDMVSVYEFRAYTEGKPVSANIYVPRTGSFNLGFRLLSNVSCGIFYFKVNNYTEAVWCNGVENDYTWLYSPSPLHLEQGNQAITVSGVGEVALDALLLYSAEDEISNVFSAGSTPTVRYVQINPGEYYVDLETNSSFLLILSEAYHPLWRMYVDGSEIKPVVTDYLVNGFFINKTGAFNARLLFTGQNYTDLGLTLSAATLLVTAAILVLPSRTFEWLGTRIRALKKRVK